MLRIVIHHLSTADAGQSHARRPSLFLHVDDGLLRAFAIVVAQTHRGVGELLGMRFLTEDANSVNVSSQRKVATRRRRKGIATLESTDLFLWFLPFRWAIMLCSLSNHFAHSTQ